MWYFSIEVMSNQWFHILLLISNMVYHSYSTTILRDCIFFAFYKICWITDYKTIFFSIEDSGLPILRLMGNITRHSFCFKHSYSSKVLTICVDVCLLLCPLCSLQNRLVAPILYFQLISTPIIALCWFVTLNICSMFDHISHGS